MKEVINLYKNHKMTVDNFIFTLIKNFDKNYIGNARLILSKYKYIQLIYAVDEYYIQTSPVICLKSEDSEHIGGNKSHYFAKMILNHDNMYISNPYIHYRTGKPSLSVVHFVKDTYYIFDFNLVGILEELKLIEFNSIHDKFKRIIYFLGSSLLAMVSIILIGYGTYLFGIIMIKKDELEFLHDIFKSIIALTLGLAIFDLAKQIFENEVLFQAFHQPEERQYKALGKFLISIVIALYIETLMVVFKIAIDDYKQMLSAFYLLFGTTVMLIGLGWFYKTIVSTTVKE